MEGVYENAEHSVNAMEDEKKIYETPCDDDEDYGPVYTEPPTKVEKIYETFEGKRFYKLFDRDIK